MYAKVKVNTSKFSFAEYCVLTLLQRWEKKRGKSQVKRKKIFDLKFTKLMLLLDRVTDEPQHWSSAQYCWGSVHLGKVTHFLRTEMIQKALDASHGPHLSSLPMLTCKPCAGVNKHRNAGIFSAVLWKPALLPESLRPAARYSCKTFILPQPLLLLLPTGALREILCCVWTAECLVKLPLQRSLWLGLNNKNLKVTELYPDWLHCPLYDSFSSN